MFANSVQVQLPAAPSLPQECGLCLESPRRSLPCSHSFCLSCLKHILQKQPRSSSFPCPTCRSPTDIPPGGVESLQSGFNWAMAMDGVSRPSDCSSFPQRRSPSGRPALTGTRDKPHKEEAAARERSCTSHPEDLLRFYCLPCRTPICRDCKLTSHENHPATSLEEKDAELKTVLSLVTQMSRASLEPGLRQSLLKAEEHQRSLKKEKEKVVEKMQQRAEDLKNAIDQALLKATQEVEETAGQVQDVVSRCVDAMTQGLASFLSCLSHVEDTVRSGGKADVVDLLPRVTKFFREACQQELESFEVLEHDPSALPGETFSLAKDGVLRSFLTDDWRVRLQLSENASTKECPFCTFRYHHKAITCPMCCHGKAKTAPASATKTFFGFKNKKSAQVDTAQLKCQTCCRSYDVTCDFCPHCGTPSSSDTLATIQTLVSRYIGHVSKEHQSGAEGEGKRSPSGSRSQSPSWKGDAGSEVVAGRPSPGAGPEAWEVYSTVCTISTLLEQSQ